MVPVHYKNVTDTESYTIWKKKQLRKGKKACSASTFKRYLKKIKQLKKPKKATDMCPLCNEGKKLEKRLSKLNIEDDFDEILKLEAAIKLYKDHKSSHEHQHDCFRKEKLDLIEGEAILVCDFKQNIVINEDATVQLSHEYYSNS